MAKKFLLAVIFLSTLSLFNCEYTQEDKNDPLGAAGSTTYVTALTSTSVTLHGEGNPNGYAATGWFRYSTIPLGTGNDSFGTRAPAAGGSSLGSGVVAVAYSQSITGLISGTTYYFCAIYANSQGTYFGPICSFTTL